MKHKFLLCSAVIFAAGFIFADEDGSSREIAGFGRKKAEAAAYCAPVESNCNECTWIQSEPLSGQYCPAYNAPAVVDVSGRKLSCFNWETGFFADASFLYWYGGEEGLNLASSGVLNTGTVFFATKTNTYYQNFDYKPGFKVGLGFVENHNWSVLAEYTWLRGTNNTHISAPTDAATAGTSTATSGTPVLLVSDWFLNGTSIGQALAGTSLKSKWHYAVDLLDLTASRPYYEGPRLAITPFAGLRAAFIRQKMIVNFTEATGTVPSLSSQPIGSRSYSHSWGIGPRFGADVKWLFCKGFRIDGDLATSLLYTRYTKISHSEDPGSTTFNPGPYKTALHDYSCLRPMAEMGLGIGWGSYFFGKKYHLDFAASYDFTYMWDQNMIRRLLDDVLTGTSPASADLYFHGLTVTGRFDF